MAAAVELEALSKQYIISLTIGGPVLLTGSEIQEAKTQFATAYLPNL
jgi:hypothetical protein